jgi:hypothetical protein
MSGQFTEKAITVTIALGKGSFGASGFNTVTVAGLRVSCTIEKYGAPGFNMAHIRIYGLPLSIMQQVSSLWVPLPVARINAVTITAGDSSGMPVAFSGDIFTAWTNLANQPDATLDIVARAGLASSMKPVPPSSFTGPTDVAVIMSGLAAQMGLSFENSGVQGIVLASQYLPGTALQQAQNAAQAANINLTIDDTTLAIWPRTGTRNGSIPLISPETGLINYPAFNGSGISLSTLYNPAIRFGGQVKVQSSIQAACGTWNVWKLTHVLEAQVFGGKWESQIEGKVANV